MITKEEPACVIVFPNRVSISIMRDKLLAVIYKPVGAFQVQQSFEKAYAHIEDIHSLNLRGIVKLAGEFYEEIKQNITT